jgi:hypothetical protein
MLDNFGNHFFVLFFGILAVENAVGFVTEADAGEAIGTIC